MAGGNIASIKLFVDGRTTENKRNIGTQTICERESLCGFPLILNIKSELQSIKLRTPGLGSRDAFVGVIVLIFRGKIAFEILDSVIGVGSERVGYIDNMRVVELVVRSEGERVTTFVKCEVVGQCESVLAERVCIGVAIGADICSATSIYSYALYLDIGQILLGVTTIDYIRVTNV